MARHVEKRHLVQPTEDFKENYPLLYAGINHLGERPIQNILERIKNDTGISMLAITGVPGAGKTTAKLSMAEWLKENIPGIHLEYLSYDSIHAELRSELAKINPDLDNDRFWQSRHWKMIWLKFREKFEWRKEQLKQEEVRSVFMIETPGIGKVQRGYQFIEYLSQMYRDKLYYFDYIANPAIQERASKQRSKAVMADLKPPDEFESFLKEHGLDVSDDLASAKDKERAFKKLLDVFGGMANEGFIQSIEQERLVQATMLFYEVADQTQQQYLYQLLYLMFISPEISGLVAKRNVRREMVHSVYRMYHKMKLSPEQAQVIVNEFYPGTVKVSLLSEESS